MSPASPWRQRLDVSTDARGGLDRGGGTQSDVTNRGELPLGAIMSGSRAQILKVA